MIARTLLLIALIPALSLAQGARPKSKRPLGSGKAELKADQPAAPSRFDDARSGTTGGKVVPFEYESNSGGTFRAMIFGVMQAFQPATNLPKP
jgi:hypothetical protein